MVCSVTLSIANQSVVVAGEKSFDLFRRIIGMGEFVVNEGILNDDALRIVFDKQLEDIEFEPYFSVEANDTIYSFGESNGCAVVTFEDSKRRVPRFRMEQISQNYFLATEAEDPNQVRMALWYALIFSFAKRNLFTIHASCVVFKDEAVLFLGKSGTGKSTHTKLWCDNFEGASLLNDDCPIIQIGERILVHGSPWSGKTHCYKKQCFPLKAVVKLKQAPENKMYQLDKQKAVAAIYRSFQPILVKNEVFADYVFDAMSEIISNVPVYHFDCLPNVEAAMLSKKMIFGE